MSLTVFILIPSNIILVLSVVLWVLFWDWSSRGTLTKTGYLADTGFSLLDHLDRSSPTAAAGILKQKVVHMQRLEAHDLASKGYWTWLGLRGWSLGVLSQAREKNSPPLSSSLSVSSVTHCGLFCFVHVLGSPRTEFHCIGGTMGLGLPHNL